MQLNTLPSVSPSVSLSETSSNRLLSSSLWSAAPAVYRQFVQLAADGLHILDQSLGVAAGVGVQATDTVNDGSQAAVQAAAGCGDGIAVAQRNTGHRQVNVAVDLAFAAMSMVASPPASPPPSPPKSRSTSKVGSLRRGRPCASPSRSSSLCSAGWSSGWSGSGAGAAVGSGSGAAVGASVTAGACVTAGVSVGSGFSSGSSVGSGVAPAQWCR